jgi:signal transduction histidine kinase
VRRRIVGLTTLAAVLAIVLFGVPLAATVANYLLGDDRTDLEHVADVAAVAASVSLARGEPLGAMPKTDQGDELGLYDATGRRVSGDGPLQADPPTRAALTHHQISSEETDELVLPISDDGSVLGVIRATTLHSKTYRQLGEAWLAMAGLGIIVVLLVWLVARGLAARLTRPLEQLAVAATALGHGDFSVRANPAGITEIDSVSGALNTTASRLDDLIARERAFSADASHQLRTPLTGLQLGLEIALDTPGKDLRVAIGTAIEDSGRLQRTIEDLLKLARRAKRTTGPLELTPLLTELEQTWALQLTAAGRALRITPAANLPPARASPAAIRQVLNVLLDNATSHGAGTVTVTARDAGDALAIDVSDQGAGVTTPPNQLFIRRAEDPSGHGIGLALARSLAEAEGGRLRLSQPAPPTFTLLIPTAAANHTVPDPGSDQAEPILGHRGNG